MRHLSPGAGDFSRESPGRRRGRSGWLPWSAGTLLIAVFAGGAFAGRQGLFSRTIRSSFDYNVGEALAVVQTGDGHVRAAFSMCELAMSIYCQALHRYGVEPTPLGEDARYRLHNAINLVKDTLEATRESAVDREVTDSLDLIGEKLRYQGRKK